MRVLHSFDITGRQALNLVFRYLPSNPSLLCSLIFTTAFLVPPKSSTSFNIFLSLTSSKISPNTFLLVSEWKNKTKQNKQQTTTNKKLFHSCFIWQSISSTQTFLPGVHEAQNLTVKNAHRAVKGSLNLIALVICITNGRPRVLPWMKNYGKESTEKENRNADFLAWFLPSKAFHMVGTAREGDPPSFWKLAEERVSILTLHIRCPKYDTVITIRLIQHHNPYIHQTRYLLIIFSPFYFPSHLLNIF